MPSARTILTPNYCGSGWSSKPLAGFAVQVRAVSLSHEELWSEGYAEGEHLRPFIEAACAFAGVVPVPAEESQS
jgi:hypothetical protein